MAIRVKYVGEWHKPTHNREIVISLPKGSTVADLLSALQVTEPEDHMVSRNSEVIGLSTALRDGDCVSIYALRRN